MIKFKVGDIVKYKAKFLQSTGQILNAPVDGKVVALSDEIPDMVKVWWCDRKPSEAVYVRASNILLASAPDYSGM